MSGIIKCFLVIVMAGFTMNGGVLAHGDHDSDQAKHESTTEGGDHHATQGEEAHSEHSVDCSHAHDTHGGEFDPGATAFHHISDANVYSIGPWSIPLPCFLYAPHHGWDVFSSSKFEFSGDSHANGHKAYNQYVLDGGTVKRVADHSFPSGSVDIGGIMHVEEEVDGQKKDVAYVCYNGSPYQLDDKSTADGGVFGGGITSFYDFSMTKNVVSLLIVFLFLSWLFLKIAKAYKTRDGQAPSGLQSLVEPVFVFIQDEVAKPFLGKKYMKFLPLLMALFFFILGLNLFGQIPFFGGSNVTGNLAFTMVIAIIVFIVTNLNGNKDYWKHILWMPGVPAWVKVILTPVEVLGLFIKPITLMLRLFANITAGHMVLVIFVSLIFVFSKNGASSIGGYGTAIPSALLTLFMMAIELLVAFIQAFVFTILTASYIGAAIEEQHH